MEKYISNSIPRKNYQALTRKTKSDLGIFITL
jgi:hypothetical protein